MEIGIDKILNALAARITANLPYITRAYGRAQIFREIWGDKGLVTIPKVLKAGGDYEFCLPQDTNTAQTYFIAVGHEKYSDFDNSQIGGIHRQFALTFWGTLGKNGVPDTLEEIKFDIIKILQQPGSVSSIDDYVDDEYKNVFPEFAYWLTRSAVRDTDKKEADTQWLMYPNAGFRLLFTATYIQPC